MKKFYMTIVAMLCGVAAMAQTCTVSAEPITAKAGDFTNLVFVLNEEPTGLIETFSIAFDLPTGVAAIWYDADEEDNVMVFSCPIAKSAHTVGLLQSDKNPQHYLFSAMSAASTFKTNADPRVAADIKLKVDASVADGEYEIANVTPVFSHEGNRVYPQDPFTVKLTVGDGTGINSINAADAKAPVYNLAGQRVSKAQNGVFIQNGKKIAVK